ncbi:hypothetical protein [Cetobacterium sp.]|uniref:hypothetical protein n=1 Tax=Cetobacterium sp. TaxID=2071632 RepID=UPI003F6818F1
MEDITDGAATLGVLLTPGALTRQHINVHLIISLSFIYHMKSHTKIFRLKATTSREIPHLKNALRPSRQIIYKWSAIMGKTTALHPVPWGFFWMGLRVVTTTLTHD